MSALIGSGSCSLHIAVLNKTGTSPTSLLLRPGFAPHVIYPAFNGSRPIMHVRELQLVSNVDGGWLLRSFNMAISHGIKTLGVIGAGQMGTSAAMLTGGIR